MFSYNKSSLNLLTTLYFFIRRAFMRNLSFFVRISMITIALSIILLLVLAGLMYSVHLSQNQISFGVFFIYIMFFWRFSNWKKTKGTSISLGTMFWNWLFSNFIYFFNHAWKQYCRKSASYPFCSTCLCSKRHGWRHNWLIKQTFQLDIF